MATTSAHVNMPAVCADKALHYALLSLGRSAHRQPCGYAQTQDMYLEIRGYTHSGLADLPIMSPL